MKFGEFIKTVREERGYDITTFSKVLGVPAGEYLDVEECLKPPFEYSLLKKLSPLLGLSPEQQDEMYELAGQELQDIPPDVKNYILTHPTEVRTIREKMKMRFTIIDGFGLDTDALKPYVRLEKVQEFLATLYGCDLVDVEAYIDTHKLSEVFWLSDEGDIFTYQNSYFYFAPYLPGEAPEEVPEDRDELVERIVKIVLRFVDIDEAVLRPQIKDLYLVLLEDFAGNITKMEE